MSLLHDAFPFIIAITVIDLAALAGSGRVASGNRREKILNYA